MKICTTKQYGSHLVHLVEAEEDICFSEQFQYLYLDREAVDLLAGGFVCHFAQKYFCFLVSWLRVVSRSVYVQYPPSNEEVVCAVCSV